MVPVSGPPILTRAVVPEREKFKVPVEIVNSVGVGESVRLVESVFNAVVETQPKSVAIMAAWADPMLANTMPAASVVLVFIFL